MPATASEQLWAALRRTRRLIADQKQRRISLSAGGAAGSSRSLHLYSGYSPGLLAGGEPAANAASAGAIDACIAGHFPAFADSWASYINDSGWFYELPQLDPALQAEIEAKYGISGMLELAEEVSRGGIPDLSRMAQLAPDLLKLEALKADDDSLQHPACFLMIRRHGLHPELAKAVLLHTRDFPNWALAIIWLMTLVAWGFFALALLDPHNPGFENESVGGVGFAHYVMLPLFGLGFGWAAIHIARDRPKRRKAWQEQLEMWKATAGVSVV